MEANAKILCKSQLENLANSFIEKDGKDLSLLILQTCSSLLGVVGTSTPVNSLTFDEVTELVRNYSVMRHIMSTFVNSAANSFNVGNIQQEIENMMEEYALKEKDYKEAEKNRDEIAEKIDKKNDEIKGVYATNDILLKSYEATVYKLERLEKLAGEFSEEALASAEQECARLTEETTALQDRQNVINAQTGECLGQISEILANLQSKVTAENANVSKVCKEADNLKKSVEVLSKVYDEYKGWFNVLKTPAQQLEEDIGKDEMESLRKYLDADKLKRKNEVVKQTTENLKYLEKLVSACSVATQEDNDNIVGRVGK